MDANTEATPDPAKAIAAAKAKLDGLVAQYQKFTDPEARNEFYHANPELRVVYSEANHH